MIGDFGYTIEIYQLDVVNSEFNRIDVITTAQNIQFFKRLNGIGGCSFQLSVYDPKLTRANFIRYRNQVAIKKNNVVLFFGPVVKLSGNFADISGRVIVECRDYLEHLRGRYTTKLTNYTQKEQTEIAWDLIDTVQSRTNGELLISQGTTLTSKDRDRTYEYGEVAQLLMNLSNVVDGFDFEFVPTVDGFGLVDGVNFNCYYPRLGNDRTDLNKLKIGENVQKMGFVTDSAIKNTLTLEGAGSGSPISYTTSNTALQRGYTRREAVYGFKDISVPETLEQKADIILNNDGTERWLAEVTMMPSKSPVLGQYGLGDVLYFDLEIDGGDYINFSGQGRVVEIQVTVDENGSELVIPKLEMIY